MIGQFGTDLNILSLLDTASRGDETFFSIPNPGAGSWSITFTTNSAQDWDTHLRARRGTTNQSTDSEISDTTPHTLTVTAQNNTDNIQLEIQWWETGGQPTSATLNVSAPAAAAGNWSLFAAAGSDGSDGARGADGAGYQWRGAWSSTTNYAIRDVVHNDGSAWVATQTSRNRTPSGSSAHWDLFAEHGEDGDDGRDGVDGMGVEQVYRRTRSSSAPSSISTTNAQRRQNGFTPSGWSSTPSGVNSTNKYEWIATRTGTSGSWGEFSAPALWAKFAEDGEDGGAADRAPGLFQIEITAAQQTALEGTIDDLPNALVTLANNATPGDNKFGDFVRFYRNDYSDYWTWRDDTTDHWERTINFLGAAQIQAVNVSALTGDFADLNVSGLLSANKIDAGNLQEITELWGGFQSIGTSTRTFTLLNNHTINEFSHIGILFGDSSNVALMSYYRSSWFTTSWKEDSVLRTSLEVDYRRNSAGTRIQARSDSTFVSYLFGIFGIGGTPSTPPAIATVTYNRTRIVAGTANITATFSSLDDVRLFQWQRTYDNGRTWHDIPNYTSRTQTTGRDSKRAAIDAIRITWIQQDARRYGPSVPVVH